MRLSADYYKNYYKEEDFKGIDYLEVTHNKWREYDVKVILRNPQNECQGDFIYRIKSTSPYNAFRYICSKEPLNIIQNNCNYEEYEITAGHSEGNVFQLPMFSTTFMSNINIENFVEERSLLAKYVYELSIVNYRDLQETEIQCIEDFNESKLPEYEKIVCTNEKTFDCTVKVILQSESLKGELIYHVGYTSSTYDALLFHLNKLLNKNTDCCLVDLNSTGIMVYNDNFKSRPFTIKDIYNIYLGDAQGKKLLDNNDLDEYEDVNYREVCKQFDMNGNGLDGKGLIWSDEKSDFWFTARLDNDNSEHITITDKLSHLKDYIVKLRII